MDREGERMKQEDHENDGRFHAKRFHVTLEETVNASAGDTSALACPVEELK